MKLPHNIDKSAFRKGYVGYSGTLVWNIEKSNSSFGRWAARNNSADVRIAASFIYAWTLDDMSMKLASFEHRAA